MMIFHHIFKCADMAELVDALVLGTSVERRGGSSPSIRTILYSTLFKVGYVDEFHFDVI